MTAGSKDSRKHRSDGDGSIYFDKARGKWIGAVVLGYVDNKPIRRKVSANSRAAALAATITSAWGGDHGREVDGLLAHSDRAAPGAAADDGLL